MTNSYSLAAVGLIFLASCASPNAETTTTAFVSPAAPIQGEVMTANGRYIVQWELDGDDITVGKPFSIAVELRGANADGQPADIELSVDARMPHHRHGMIVVPTLRRTSDNTWRCEGMAFQMPGYWEFYFDVLEDGGVTRAQDDVTID